MKLTVLDEVTSTNEVVKNALREGKAEGPHRARSAPAERLRPPGPRMGFSPEGRPACIILLRPDVAGSGLATLSLVVGLSVQRALGQVAAPQFEDGIQVKWPNDVIYMPADCQRADEYRKLCGISLEACGGGVRGYRHQRVPPRGRPSVQGRNVPSTWRISCRPLNPSRGISCHWPRPSRHCRSASRLLVARRSHHDIQREVIARILVNYGRWRELGFMPTLGSYEARPSSPVARCASTDAAGTATLEHGHWRRRARPPSRPAPPTTPSPSPPASPRHGDAVKGLQ